jgi:hypothetical protein
LSSRVSLTESLNLIVCHELLQAPQETLGP